MDTSVKRFSWLRGLALVAGCGVMVVATAGVSMAVPVRSLSLKAAQDAADKAQSKSKIPIRLTPEVLSALNHAASTPATRKNVRDGLIRMESYRRMISQALEKADLPLDLLAVPLWESRYRNVDNGTSAGIWQFIASTARRYGLEVSARKDERFDPELETGAAVRYLTKLYADFGDWHAALLAYNSGESALRDAMEAAGTRDAFEIVRGSWLSRESRRYLPYVIAALIILHNPELVQE